jgi:acetoin utilization protein AcuB
LSDPERTRALREIRVGDVMTREVITVDPQDSIENAAQEMYELKIESVPVVAEEESLEIVTSSDVMRALVMLAGLPDPGCQIEARAPNRVRILAEVAGKSTTSRWTRSASSPTRTGDPATVPWYSSWRA